MQVKTNIKAEGVTPIHNEARVVAAALALLLFAFVAPAAAHAAKDKKAPDLGEYTNLRVPAGNKLAFRLYAAGVQIYRWDGTTWVFVAPEAALFDDDCDDDDPVGIHYAGPTWESSSGSKVVATVLERATPDPDSIPWLLLKAVSNEGHGMFRRVTYIQRLYTEGGKAPTEPGDYVGEEVEVPYTTEYFFYRAK